MRVPLFDTSTPRKGLRAELDGAVARVLDSERYILGPELAAFEQELAEYCGVRHAVGVANGTDALTLALRAMGVGHGDDVVVPSFTFYASAEVIPPIGARPVFCDIDLETFCVTADTVKAALTPRTKAVIAVDLFGNLPPIAEIEALGVPVLEDAAQALGTTGPAGRAGSLGSAATLSFFPSKNLGCFGDGGAILTSDSEFAENVRMLRFHGSRDKVNFEHIGYNSRLDALQAAILRVQLPHLDEWAARRYAIGREYEAGGLGEVVALPRPADGVIPAWHLYVVRSDCADELADALSAEGIGNRAYYRVPLHRQPALREFGDGIELPVTDVAARTNLAVPMSPALTTSQVRAVCEAARATLGCRAA